MLPEGSLPLSSKMSGAGAGSPPDSSKLTTLLIKDIPEELNRRDALLNHFSQFGEVTRVQCRADSTAIVHFKEHRDALTAKNKGKKVSQYFFFLFLSMIDGSVFV